MKKKTIQRKYFNPNLKLFIKKESNKIEDINKLFQDSRYIESPFGSMSNISIIKKNNKNFDFYSPNSCTKKIDSFSFLLDSEKSFKIKNDEENISIDLNNSIDPDSSKLEIIYQKFEKLLKNLSEEEKKQNNFLITNLDFDQKIDYIKKFIISHKNISENQNFVKKENIDINSNENLLETTKQMKLGDLLIYMANDNSLSDIKNNQNFLNINMKKAPYKKIQNLNQPNNLKSERLKKSNFYFSKIKNDNTLYEIKGKKQFEIFTKEINVNNTFENNEQKFLLENLSKKIIF